MTKKTKDTKQDKPVEGFDNLVKAMLNTPPSPKPDASKKDGKPKTERRAKKS